ncbi:MAG: M48 family metallopeptidase [Endomicrobium sp.]|jgi:STE24 endopeptidase|nr:M48 family metallopeptidase [Endomicrobium sp.]
MNISNLIVICSLVLIYFLELLSNILNINKISDVIPAEFYKYINEKKYKISQRYLKVNTKFQMLHSFFTLIFNVFLIFIGFNYINELTLFFSKNILFNGVFIANVLIIIVMFLKIPFLVYHTFVIENKFGFNRTNLKTFCMDIIKYLLINIILTTILFSMILWLFLNISKYAWFFVFIIIGLFQIAMMIIAPKFIMPLFNKYSPIEDKNLKKSIKEYAKTQDFKIQGIFKMDGSKRSTKSNAFFTGIGKFHRIVLFDTLLQNHNIDEIVCILAHEMGHFKLGHLRKNMIMMFVVYGLIIWLFSNFIKQNWLYNSCCIKTKTIYIGMIILITIVSIPINFLITVLFNYYSRIYEYQADEYAVVTYNKPEVMIHTLKKLSVNNLSNLTPHPFKVFFEYSHPTILERIKKIKENNH